MSLTYSSLVKAIEPRIASFDRFLYQLRTNHLAPSVIIEQDAGFLMQHAKEQQRIHLLYYQQKEQEEISLVFNSEPLIQITGNLVKPTSSIKAESLSAFLYDRSPVSTMNPKILDKYTVQREGAYTPAFREADDLLRLSISMSDFWQQYDLYKKAKMQ